MGATAIATGRRRCCSACHGGRRGQVCRWWGIGAAGEQARAGPHPASRGPPRRGQLLAREGDAQARGRACERGTQVADVVDAAAVSGDGARGSATLAEGAPAGSVLRRLRGAGMARLSVRCAVLHGGVPTTGLGEASGLARGGTGGRTGAHSRGRASGRGSGLREPVSAGALPERGQHSTNLVDTSTCTHNGDSAWDREAVTCG